MDRILDEPSQLIIFGKLGGWRRVFKIRYTKTHQLAVLSDCNKILNREKDRARTRGLRAARRHLTALMLVVQKYKECFRRQLHLTQHVCSDT
jgi:hypothetical protein